MPGLVLKLDTSQAAASSQKLRENLKSLGATSQMTEDQIKSLETRMLRGMGADKAKSAIEEVARSTKMTAMEMQRFQKQIGDVSGRVDTLKGHFSGLASKIVNFKNLLIGTAAAFGAFKLGNSFVQTASMFEGFNASLQTITGSAAKAKEAMSWIETFTAKTPYELQEVTSNFIKLSNYGLDAKRVMGLLGNTAGAMSKSLSQASEMLADAVTGENERMKEFGVTAKKQGENVTYMWTEMGKKMEYTTKLTSENVIVAFEKIFSRFKGGMDKQSKTWAGMMSNMSDHWTLFVKDVMMKSGLYDVLKEKLKTVLDAIDKLEKDGRLEEWAINIGKAILTLGDLIQKVAKVAIVGGLLFAISQLPAAIALAEASMIKFNMSLYAGEVQAIATAGGITALKGALNVLIAAFAGWQIGQWLYDNFEWARLAGLAFVDSIMRGWIEIKYGALTMIAGFRGAWQEAMNAMSGIFIKYLEGVASGVDKIPGLGKVADDLRFNAAKLKAAKAGFEGIDKAIGGVRNQYQAALKEHNATIESIRKEHVGYKETTESAKASGEAAKQAGEAAKKGADGAAKATKGAAKAAKDAQQEYEKLVQKADQFYQQLYQGQKGKTKGWYDYELEGIKKYKSEAEATFKAISETGKLSAEQRLIIEEDYQEKLKGLFEETLNVAIDVNKEEIEEFDKMLEEISENRQDFFGDDLSDYKNHLGNLEQKLKEHVKEVLGIEELSAEQRMAIKEKMAEFEEKLNQQMIETEKERLRIYEDFYSQQGAGSRQYLEIQAQRIDERAEQLRAAGVEEIDIQKWVNEEIIKLNEERYDEMYSTTDDFFGQLSSLLSGEVKDWKSALGSLANAFGSMFNDLSRSGQQSGGGFWSGLSNWLGGSGGGGGGGGGGWLGTAASAIGSLFGSGGSGGGGGWLGTAADWVGGLFSSDGGGGGITSAIGGVVDTAADWVGGLFDAGSQAVNAGVSAATSAGGMAVEAGTGAVSSAGTGVVGDALGSYGSYISGAINVGGALLSGDNPFENQYGNEALGVVQALGQFSEYGAILSTAGEWLGGLVGEEGAQIGAGIGAGAGVGATVGSVVPVIGTAVGTAVGAVVGGIASAFGLDSQKDFKVGVHRGESGFFDDITQQGFWEKRGGNEDVQSGIEEMVKQTQGVVWNNVREVTEQLPEDVQDEFTQVLSGQSVYTDIFVRQSYLEKDMKNAQEQIVTGMWGATVPAFQAVADDIIGQYDLADVEAFGMSGIAEQIRQGPQMGTFEIEDEEGNITETEALDIQGYMQTIAAFESGMEQVQAFMDNLNESIESMVDGMISGEAQVTEYDQAVSGVNQQFAQIEKELSALSQITGINIDLEEKKALAMDVLNKKFQEQRDEIWLAGKAMTGFNDGLTEYDIRIKEVNEQFDGLKDQLKQSGASVEELTSFEGMRVEVLEYEAKVFKEARDELIQSAREMASVDFEANTNMFDAAREYVNSFFDDLMVQYQQLGASASELAVIEGMRHEALIAQVSQQIFPEINADSIASLFSSAIQAAVDQVAAGGEVDYAAVGTEINNRIASAMRTSIVNAGIGQVSEAIQQQMITPFMNNIVQGFLGQGFNIETIQSSFKQLQNLDIDNVSAGVTELFTALMSGEEINWEDFVERYGSELETAFGDLAAMEPEPMELNAPDYKLPDSYNNTVYIDPPVYDPGSYDSTVHVSAPAFEVEGGVEGASKVEGEAMADGKWNIPADGFPAILHQGEAVIRREDAPLVRSVLRSAGLSGKYGAGSGGAHVSGIQSYAVGSLNVWQTGDWFTSMGEATEEISNSMESASGSVSNFSSSLGNATSSMDNTTDQLRQIWDDFRGIQFSDLAPVQSEEQFSLEYQKLLSTAETGGVEEYRALADFSKSTLLPFMETYADVNYREVYDQVYSDVGSVHGFISGDSKVTPSDNILPESSSLSSNSSEGVANEVANEVGDAISYAIETKTQAPSSEVTVRVYIDGKEIKPAMLELMRGDSEIIQAGRSW